MKTESVHIGDLVDWAITRQSWANFFLYIAFWLGIATGLLIALFQVAAWKEAVLIWASDQEMRSLVRAVADGTWVLPWRQWAAIGAGSTTLLLAGWYLLNHAVAEKMRAVPGLRAAVGEERKERRWQSFQTAGCILALLFFPLFIAWSMAHPDAWDDD